jgi:transposase
MLGKRSAQRGLFEADHLYLDYVGRDTFYGFLASQRGKLFRDQEFAEIYCPDNGRASVPPSLLATALLLQTHDRVSDEEAKRRADYDLCWKVALGIGIEDRPFAKSTLQLFRAHLVLHDKVRAVFQRSLELARKTRYLRKRKIRVALDTSHILGKGAVKDTYNLLADGIAKLARALASGAGEQVEAWARERGLARYFGSSLKGEASIDWDDEAARRALLGEVVADADRLLEMARQVLESSVDDVERERPMEAAALLAQLLLQDIERRPDGVAIKEGVSQDRIVSAEDPEMRHGHKSKSQRFEGHKMAVAVDTESQLITAVAVLPGNAPDSDRALELVEESEENARVEVEEAIGDCAYGDGTTRQEFADAGRKLVARVPKRPHQSHFPKEDFTIDLQTMTCRCPAGQITGKLVRRGRRRDRLGGVTDRFAFQFEAAVCDSCALRGSCVKGKPGRGRSVSLHPQEALLQEARAFQHSAAYAPYRALRQVAEHRIARLVQLGARQARHFGRRKTLFQLLIAATVANLTLVATKTGLMRGPGRRCGEATGRKNGFSFHFSGILDGIRASTSRFCTAFRLGDALRLADTPVSG